MAKLLRYIKNQEPIPEPLMLEAFNVATNTLGTSERREIANKIVKGAGDYLPDWHLVRLITAEMSSEEALEIVAGQKAFIDRARHLMPSLLSLFGVRDDSNLESILIRIYDCCQDFPIIRRSAHENKVRKDAANKIREMKARIAALHDILESVGHHLKIDFNDHMTAVSDFRKESHKPPMGYFDVLREGLDCLSLIADITLYREGRGEGAILVTNNKAKTHVVECVYSIGLWLECPLFVTTPGSNFSIACSLLYELASNEKDISLAGAINKFSRSNLRRRLNDERRETRWENSEEGKLAREADNFAPVKERITNLGEERKFWEEVISSKDWSDFEKRQMNIRVLHVADQLKLASLDYGPHLVWADQTSENDQTIIWRRMREWEAQKLQSEIELGRMRRKQRRH